MNFSEFDHSVALGKHLPLRDGALFDQLLEQFRDRIVIGWPLNPHALRAAIWSLEGRESADRPLRAVEFGSGVSTLFLNRYFRQRLQMWSYEHDPDWIARLREEEPNLNLLYRPLLSFPHSAFVNWIRGATSDWRDMRATGEAVPDEQRQDYGIPFAFHAMEPSELPSADLYIVDGPQGHGRSVAYRMIAQACAEHGDCDVLIDDVNHYPFLHDAACAFRFNVMHGELLPHKRWVLLKLMPGAPMAPA